MLKVIIADDENIVCHLIQSIISWEELGYEVVATADNGLDTLNLILKFRPDVVITDIRMPGYDGIELIKHTHKHNLFPEFIIISGYRYFEYAHNALQFGVGYYFLKPVNQEELTNALIKIKEKRLKEAEKLQNEIDIKKQIHMNRDKIHRYFITNIIFNTSRLSFEAENLSSIDKINHEYQFNFQNGYYQALFVKLDRTGNPVKTEKILESIDEETKRFLQLSCQELVDTITHSGVIIILNYPVIQKENIQKSFIKLYERLSNMVDVFNCFKITFGLSACITDFAHISEIIASAGEAVRYRIREKDKQIIRFDEYHYERVPIQQIVTPERRDVFRSYLETNEIGNIAKLLETCSKEIHEVRDINPVILYELSEEIGSLVDDFAEKTPDYLQKVRDYHVECNDIIDNANDEKQIWNALMQFIEGVIRYLENEKEFQNKKPIRMAKQYIDENYMHNIGLDEVADEIHLSSAYLSTMFRKETGLNFSEYLSQRRMQKAKELLRKSDDSIGQIAEQVGYMDTKYFSRLFNKIVGLKPSEFRKLYS